VTVLKRGAAPVDPRSGFVYTHQVYADAEGVWDAMLNQTDISGSKNSNKFYVIQVLHPIGNTSTCQLFVRWGRIGENGQSQVKVRGPWDPARAVQEFKKQFKTKAGVNWEQRHGMTAKKGKYVWIERSFEEEKDEDKEEGSSSKEKKKKEEAKPPASELAPELQALAEVIEKPNCDSAVQMGGQRNACEELSGRYYSIIPHAFGRNRPVVIDNMATLKKELELVDALGDMEVAQELIKSTIMTDEDGKPLNPLDAHFKSLKLSRMDPLDRGNSEFAALEKYARDTHGATHRFQAKVLNIFAVERQSETEAWHNAGFDKLEQGKRRLLWHGSRSTNFAGILSQGLRIAPPEGYMFGKGVYFADSAGYCYTHLSNGVGILLLCEVAVKPFFEQYGANSNAAEECKAEGKLCTLGLGRTQPVDWQDAGEVLGNPELKGCEMPKGGGQDVNSPNAYLQYNEASVQ
ncbi:PARP-domain-containing protein, partial [Gloeophyllum trabeum ATCC 11539]